MMPLRLLVALCGLGLLACGPGESDGGDGGTDAGDGADGGGTFTFTYHRDVRPIMAVKCTRCHSDGNIAPFAFDSYQAVFDVVDMVQFNVVNRIMPPWLATPGCATYKYDESLSPAQIDLIDTWVTEGAPEGDPADYAGPIDPGPQPAPWANPDVSIGMDFDYTPTLIPDDYRCFTLDWPETTRKFITGFMPNPGNLAIVHHIIAFGIPPADAAAADAKDTGTGYTCFGGPGVGDVIAWLGSWAPGAGGGDYPAGTGIPIEPGSRIVMQVHYNTLNGVQTDRTSIEFKTADTVATEAFFLPWLSPQWLNGNMSIPAGEPDVAHSMEFDPTQALGFINPAFQNVQTIDIHLASLHMHQLGTGGTEEIRRADGATECLLEVDDWDFSWQRGFLFDQPKRLSRGDTLYLECHWDNTAANQGTINGVKQDPVDVNWGEGTQDEMCLGVFYVTPVP